MTDPAVEASQRACSCAGTVHSSRCLAAAAREALKPIQEKCELLKAAAGERLHPTDPGYDIGNAFDDGVLSMIDELAPLLYTPEELEQ